MTEIEMEVVSSPAADRDKKIVRLSPEDARNNEMTGGIIVISLDDKRAVAQVSIGNNNNGTITVPVFMRETIDARIGSKVTIYKSDETPALLNGRLRLQVIASEQIEKIDENVIEQITRQFKKNYTGSVPMIDGEIYIITLPNHPWKFYAKVSLQRGIWYMGEETEIIVNDKTGLGKDTAAIGWDDIGGMDDVIEMLKHDVILPLVHPELFDHYNKSPKKGILLKGPPGCGKTLLIKALSREADGTFFPVRPSDIFRPMLGDSEGAVRRVFDEAKKKSPSIIFFDEIDAILPKRGEGQSASEQRVISEMLDQMDGMKTSDRVIVIGATNRPNAIDPAARRPGRFEREIDVPPPSEEGRKEILKIHLRGVPTVTNIGDPMGTPVNVDDLATNTNGFVGADLAGLVREAIFRNIKRNTPDIDLETDVIPDDQLERLKISQEDLFNAKDEITPSALRSVSIQIPNITWDEIGGYREIKQKMKETVIWNTEMKDKINKMGITLPKGILLYGPPGTGKTLLGKAIANESKCNFISVKGPEFLSKWVGESERAVREVFKKARQAEPCIIFIDEIDSIAPMRGLRSDTSGATDRVVTQLLSEMDGIEKEKEVIVIASTNRPDIIDPALLRPGRMDRIIHVHAPDKETRIKILSVHLINKKISKSLHKKETLDKVLDEIANETNHYSGSDLEALIMEAGILALRDDRDHIMEKDLLNACKEVHASLTEQQLKMYEEIEKNFKQNVVKKRIDLNYTS